MYWFISFLAAMTLCLIGIMFIQVIRLGREELRQRYLLTCESRRNEALALREQRKVRRLQRVTPTEFIGEYIDSLLGQQNIIAGTATQIEHWTKAKRLITPNTYTFEDKTTSQQDPDDWIVVEQVSSLVRLKAVS